MLKSAVTWNRAVW